MIAIQFYLRTHLELLIKSLQRLAWIVTSTWIGWSHQVARCRFECQTYTKCNVYDYRNTSNVHSLMTTNVNEQTNSRWTTMHRWNSKLLGGSSIIESLEQDTTRTSPLSQLFVERKVQGQKWPWSWSIGQHTLREESLVEDYDYKGPQPEQ